jgi:serine/threonine protein kinase
MVGGRYQLLTVLGQGGMGRVWHAQDTVLRREIAVKEVLLPDGVAGIEREELIRRAEHEARAASRLHHPNIVAVHDVVNEGDVPWIIMDLVHGPSLSTLLRQEGRIGWERAVGFGLELAEALAHAHSLGVVHRDLKPDNILISAGHVVLTDFSIARVLDGTTHLTRTGSAIGTPQYMSPEQVEGKVVGTPSDLWSLGATLYTAVEGRNPFTRDNLGATYAAILTQPPAQPTQAGPMLGLLGDLLRKNPNERPSAAYAADVLRHLHDAARAPGGPGANDAGSMSSTQVPIAEPAPHAATTVSGLAGPPAPGPAPQGVRGRRTTVYAGGAVGVVLAALVVGLIVLLPGPHATPSNSLTHYSQSTGPAQSTELSTNSVLSTYMSEGEVFIQNGNGDVLDLNPDKPQSGPVVTNEKQESLNTQVWDEYENQQGQIYFLNLAYPTLALTVGARSNTAVSEGAYVTAIGDGVLSEDQLWWQEATGSLPSNLVTVETVNSIQKQACMTDEGQGNDVEVAVCGSGSTVAPDQQWTIVSAATPSGSGASS